MQPYHDTDQQDVGGPHAKPQSDIDVNGGTFPGREPELLCWLVDTVQAVTDLPQLSAFLVNARNDGDTLDGTRWTVLEEHTEDWYTRYGNVSLSPSGEIWRAGPAVNPTWERFDGERWIPVVTGVPALGPPSIAEDGTLWFLGPSGVYRASMEEAPP